MISRTIFSVKRLFICLFLLESVIAFQFLPPVDGDQVKKLIETKNHVAVFFKTDDCYDCRQKEPILVKANNLLTESDGITVVAVSDHQTGRDFGIYLYPKLIYFRNKVPILYDDKYEPELISDWLVRNRESFVIHLNDSNFEHNTQAASGATTGDWLVLFTHKDCATSKLYIPTWESVADRLKRKINVAKVDLAISPRLKARFDVARTPIVYFFRNGKMYGYFEDDHSSKALLQFATEKYAARHGEPVPGEPSFFHMFIPNLAKQTNLPESLVHILLCLIAGLGSACMVVSYFYLTRRNSSRSKFD